MIAAVAVFSVMDALLKLLSAHYPPLEVAVLRGARLAAVHLLPVLLTRALARPASAPLSRCTCCAARSRSVVLGGFIYAVRALSLANAYAVFLSAPLLVTALAVPLLQGARRLRATGSPFSSGSRRVDHAQAERLRGLVSIGALAAFVSGPAPTRSAASPCGC